MMTKDWNVIGQIRGCDSLNSDQINVREEENGHGNTKDFLRREVWRSRLEGDTPYEYLSQLTTALIKSITLRKD